MDKELKKYQEVLGVLKRTLFKVAAYNLYSVDTVKETIQFYIDLTDRLLGIKGWPEEARCTCNPAHLAGFPCKGCIHNACLSACKLAAVKRIEELEKEIKDRADTEQSLTKWVDEAETRAEKAEQALADMKKMKPSEEKISDILHHNIMDRGLSCKYCGMDRFRINRAVKALLEELGR